ncbi:helicase-associated domain-containing protein [Isoptericola jiangsuensis]|uniref:helicase-associated domain-containing protein n=1 Tax=Isoptericola jiangsuensis TaxID=548579 RepID=UPI003AAE471B
MAATFSEWVRRRTDPQLVALLAARPDLGTPAPSTLRSLAARASSRTSTERAVAHLDAGTLQVLEALVALADDTSDDAAPDGAAPDAPAPDVTAAPSDTAPPVTAPPVTAVTLAAAVGAPEATDVVEQLLDRARTAALVWDDASGLRPAPGLGEVLGPYPAGLGPGGPATGSTRSTGLGSTGAEERTPGEQQVLDALTWGPPVGIVPPVGSPARSAVDSLLADGLLLRTDARHVQLPRAVGLALRGGRTHRAPQLVPPRPPGRPAPRVGVDAEAATAGLAVVRHVARLVDAWGDDSPRALRAGGLSVRDLRRTAQLLDTDETTTALVVELAATAGLVADDGESPATYVPTVRADRWEEADDAGRWAALVVAWSTSRRTPWQIGSRDERGTVRAPLSADLHRPWVPLLRAAVLEVLAAQPDESLDTTAVAEVLRWRSPRSVPPDAAVAGLLAEATLLGVTGAGALSTPGAALTGSPADSDLESDLAARMRLALPAEVHEILLQGDLTGIVPGRPAPDLARLVALTADVESRGAATTVRFTTASVTRALDHGRTGEEVLAELAQRSPVPVPQPLEYLVKDTARRHDALRVGAAVSYVRSADPTVLAGLTEDPRLAALGLVRLAPTVVAAAVPPAELHEALRERGLLSALEGPDGRAVGRRARAPRLDRSGWVRRSPAPVRGTDDAARAGIVARMRGTTSSVAPTGPRPGEDVPGPPPAPAPRAPGAGAGALHDGATAPGAGPVSEPGDALALLHEAIRDGRRVWIEMAGRTGAIERRELKPLRLDGGRLRALDTEREAELTVAVHRIAAVEPAG